MNKKFLKKIIAHSPEDLKLISACCSEGKVKISEIKYLPKNKIFLLFIDRIVKEEENNKDRVNSIIKFEYVYSSRSKNINQKLILGSSMFGIGWGLIGLCPGPAISSIAFLQPLSILFIISMMSGYYLTKFINI